LAGDPADPDNILSIAKITLFFGEKESILGHFKSIIIIPVIFSFFYSILYLLSSQLIAKCMNIVKKKNEPLHPICRLGRI
jgi:hypothetical protein